MIKKSYWQKVDDSDHTDSRSVYDKLGDEYHNLKRENAELKAKVSELEFQCSKYEHSIQGTMLSEIKADAIAKYNEFLLKKYRLQLSEHANEFLERGES